jgi:iron(III) transport system ATP-binding protein
VELLRLSQIGKTEGDRRLLSDINLVVQPYTRTALIGETGSGKSTLLKIMAGLCQPTHGTALFEGKRIEGPLEVLIPGHKQIGYLSQHFELLNNYRVEELLDMANKMDQREADEVYRLCKIEHLLKRKTNAISGGERQRIALARVLVGQPKLLLLDEPFTNLDLSNNKIINSIIKELCDSKKTTVVLVSHDPSNILSWANHIIVLQEGQIIQEGTPTAVYYTPVNTYAAGLLGDFNHIEHNHPMRKELHLPNDRSIFRPEEFTVTTIEESRLHGVVKEKLFYGDHYKLTINLADNKLSILVRSTSATIDEEVGVVYNNLLQ